MENLHKKTPEEIAGMLNRSVNSVNLYIHFNRLNVNETNNLLIQILKKKFIHPENFKTCKEFFQAVKIRQGRFWQIYRGEKRMTEEEYQALITYFELSSQEAFSCRQLKLNLSGDNK